MYSVSQLKLNVLLRMNLGVASGLRSVQTGQLFFL